MKRALVISVLQINAALQLVVCYVRLEFTKRSIERLEIEGDIAGNWMVLSGAVNSIIPDEIVDRVFTRLVQLGALVTVVIAIDGLVEALG